jgi:hypothetical protein
MAPGVYRGHAEFVHCLLLIAMLCVTTKEPLHILYNKQSRVRTESCRKQIFHFLCHFGDRLPRSKGAWFYLEIQFEGQCEQIVSVTTSHTHLFFHVCVHDSDLETSASKQDDMNA